MYFSSVYWLDKYVLLRASRLPPQISSEVIDTAGDLLPLAIFLHCIFAAWIYSHNLLFPSSFVSAGAEAIYNRGSSLSSDFLNAMLAGETTSSLSDYQSYLVARLAGLFRRAAFPNLLLAMVLTLVYITAAISMGFSRNLFVRVVKKQLLRQDASIKFGGFTQSTFTSARENMIRNRILHTYDISNNPRYSTAVRAISHVESRRQGYSLEQSE